MTDGSQQAFRVRCRIGGGPAPCFDDLCHSGSETLCGIPYEWLHEEWGEEFDLGEDYDDA